MSIRIAGSNPAQGGPSLDGASALTGYWHWLRRGKRSEVLDDVETGLIVIPRP